MVEGTVGEDHGVFEKSVGIDVLQQAGAVPGDTVYARVSPDMLLDGPAGERLYAKLPREADPDMVLARIARLRAA